MDWQGRSAAELGAMIGDGRLDPSELVEAVLAAIRGSAHGERIYARLTEERALAEAAAAGARARSGMRRGPLDGVPLSWKDLFDTAGVATEAGSRLLRGRVPERDAALLAAATAGGSVCVGKTHMSELAFSGLGFNPMAGTPPNVNDADAVPGGSSSGAAASVAFGLAPAAIGSDTGGSVRTPAAWNDLVGLKTTHGRLSNEGVVPLCETLDTAGPLTRTVEDAALVLALLEGGRPADLGGATLSGVRLAVLETVAMEGLEDAPARAFDEALGRLERAGAAVERIEAPLVADVMEVSAPLYATEAYAIWRERMEAAPGTLFGEIEKRILAGRDTPAHVWIHAWREVRRHRAAWGALVAGFDAVVCPTVPILPPKVAEIAGGGDAYVRRNLQSLRNTRIFNLLGGAGLTVPTGVPSCGILFSGPAMSEGRLLRLGAAAERALS
jgi:aspartyl-tRNA(Asn)/glutamyl-tRNA(Gln) amidotransferase subunit A